MSLTSFVKNISEPRATNDVGAMLCEQNTITGKYHFYAGVTGIPATGAAPATTETTVTTSTTVTNVQSRPDSPQMEFSLMVTMDNQARMNADRGTTKNFLILMPNFTAYRFTAQMSNWLDAFDVGAVPMLKMTLTVTSQDEDAILNALPLMEDIVTFPQAIQEVYEAYVDPGDLVTVRVETSPSTATLTVKTLDDSIATATVAGNVVSLAPVAAGSTIVEVTGTPPVGSSCASNTTRFKIAVGATAPA